MKNTQKGSVNIWLVVIIVILVIALGYFAFMKKPIVENQQLNSVSETPTTNGISNSSQTPVKTASQTPTEGEIIQKLLSSWKSTQSNFSVKAGESGTFNPPSKIQFISSDTMLIYYDDGLVDHISVIQYKNNNFTELKSVGVMSTMPLNQWQTLVNTYGNSRYSFSSYQSSDYKSFTKVSSNIFVR